MRLRIIPSIAAAATAGMLLIGCSGSEEMQKAPPPPPAPAAASATEMMQKELTTQRNRADSLEAVAVRSEQDKRALAARVADLETQLNDLKAKQEAPPPPPEAPRQKHIRKPSEVQPVTDPREGYDRALTAFRERRFEEAAGLFQGVLDAGAPHGLEDNCAYWLGECAFAQKKYQEAIEHFTHVFSFERSEKKDDAQMMIANAYAAMGDKKKAKEAYQLLVKKFPASPFVKRAKAKMASF